jgi:hypothetical protein
MMRSEQAAMSDHEPGTQRILLIDLLRGMCVVGMIIAHLPGDPLNFVSNAAYSPIGFFSGASIFVALSGWIAGHVYGQHRTLYGNESIFRRIFSRAAKLYLAQMLLLFALGLAVMLHFHGASTWNLYMFQDHPLRAFLMGIVLLYEPGYLGILPMFCFFLVITPLLLYQLQKGQVWRVLTESGLLWLIAGLAGRLPTHNDGINFGGFNPFSYQIIFVAGVVLGETGLKLKSFEPFARGLIIGFSLAFTSLFFVLRVGYLLSGSVMAFIEGLPHPLFSLLQMGPLRMLNFAAFLVVLSWGLSYTRPVAGSTRFVRWLILLGQNSLLAFVFSILYTYAAISLIGYAAPLNARIADIFVAVACVSLLTLLSVVLTVRRSPSVFFMSEERYWAGDSLTGEQTRETVQSAGD